MLYEIIKGLGNLSDIFEAGENIFQTIKSQIQKRKIKNSIFLKFIELCENKNLSNNEMNDILHLFSCNEKIQKKNVFIQLNAYNSNDFLNNAKSKLSSQLYTKFKKIWNELQEYGLETNYESLPDYINYLARMLNYQKEELIEYFGKNGSGTYIPTSKSISLKDLELEKCPDCGNRLPLEYVLEEKSDGLKIIRAFCKSCGRSFVKLDYQFLVQASNNNTIDEDALTKIFEQEIEKYNQEIMKVINDKTKGIESKIDTLENTIVESNEDILNEILKQMPDIIKKQFDDKDSRTIENCYQLIKTEFEQSLPNKFFIETQCEKILQIDSNNIRANFFKVFINRKNNLNSYEIFLKLLPQKSLSLEELNEIAPFIIKNCTYRTKDIVIEFLKAKSIYDLEKEKEIEESLKKRDKELDWFADVERDVFICYSSNDRSKATFIVEELEKEGYECWIDYRNMEHPQDNYYKKINANLQLCKVFVFISSISSIRSTECHNEIRIASTCEKPMIEYLISQDENNYRPQVLKTYFRDEWIDSCQTDKVDELIKKIEDKFLSIKKQNITKLLQNKKEDSTSNENTTLKETSSCKKEEKTNEVSSKIFRTTENESIYELEFILDENKKSYSVTKSKETANNIIIPSLYRGLPVTSIDSYAFYNCSNLTSVVIPDSVTSIGKFAFGNCSNLTSIIIPNSVISIGEFAFFGCSSLKYNKYNGVNYLGNKTNPCLVLIRAWGNRIIISTKTRFIYDSAFKNDFNLERISIPDGVTSIGKSAFENCNNLTSITIPSSVISIGESAFFGCSSLKYNTYRRVDYLGNKTNPYLVLIKAKNPKIKKCKMNKNTRFIYGKAFENCSDLTNIIIPNSVMSLGIASFSGCSSLIKIAIPCGVTRIRAFSFYECRKLKNITIPNSVISIGIASFSGCSNLEEIYYKGLSLEWKRIKVECDNLCLNTSFLYYYSETKPTSDGNYWHYVNNEIVKWN